MPTAIVIGESVRFSDGEGRVEVPLEVLREIVASLDGGPSEEWVLVEDAAEALGVSASTVRNWCRDGTLCGRKVGRRWHVGLSGVRKLGGGYERAR